MRKHNTTVLFTLVLVLLAGADVFGATVTSSQSGNWNSTATWGGNPVPGSADLVIINGGFTVTVDITNAACASLQLGGTASGTGGGTVLFTGGSQLTVSGLVTVGVSNNPGSITMTSGGTLTCEGFSFHSLGTWTPGAGVSS